MNDAMVANNIRGFSFIGISWAGALGTASDIAQFLLIGASLIAAVFLGLYNREKYRTERRHRIKIESEDRKAAASEQNKEDK